VAGVLVVGGVRIGGGVSVGGGVPLVDGAVLVAGVRLMTLATVRVPVARAITTLVATFHGSFLRAHCLARQLLVYC
jgi:hypothetical protein